MNYNSYKVEHYTIEKTNFMHHCTLTNTDNEKCCCEKRGGKFYCTLAKKTLDTCCCEPAAEPADCCKSA